MNKVMGTTLLAIANESPNASYVSAVEVTKLTAACESEVLEFLSQRPIHTVALVSLIRDNGLVSPFNRGTFFGCRDLNGKLEGVALVGHATLLETVSDRALRALAHAAREQSSPHMIMAERDRVAEFWEEYSDGDENPRLVSRELLFEVRWPVEAFQPVPELRRATLAELELVMPIQARLAFEESGVDPMQTDPIGFRERCERRIQQGRTWVLMENDSLVFKADVISETAEVIYLEGIWVREDERGNGIGARCLSHLSRRLLAQVKSICLLVNDENKPAQAFYRKCGFLFRATYETIFLRRQVNH